jgi:glutathione peroxidase
MRVPSDQILKKYLQMKKFLLFALSVAGVLFIAAQSKTIYSYKVEGLTGDEIDFSKFKGKKILVVNTASKCGFTPQYADLEKIYQDYKDKLVIVGFPANNFGQQEPGTNEDIHSFCEANYGVSFPMAAKVSVKGEDIAPIFKFLTEKKLNGVKDTDIAWNFTKFLLDDKGKLINSFPSKVKPTDEAIVKYLK